ncbi:MAG: hypothetical protein J6W82_11125 [Bacteroidales bacterium]|nr:hypothetical protein [Bacteroidales bacterium]
MAEPRKIVLILGNGFDLDLGYKTSYKDFWESEYCPKDYPAPIIYHLNQRWKDGLDAVKWYDLENELLSYYRQLKDPHIGADFLTEEEKKFLQNFESYRFLYRQYDDKIDIINSLIDKGVLSSNGYQLYWSCEDNHQKEDCAQSPIWRDKKALRLIKDGLCSYIKNIDLQSKKDNTVALNVLFAANCAREVGNFLSVYSFNYTKLPVDYGDGFINTVHYVHGTCEKGKIIIGTKDDDFVKSYDFLQKSFNPDFNPPAIVADLLDADEVIIFGHSIGENDSQYFKAFFKQQVDVTHPKKKDIYIFTRDEESKVEIKRSLQKMTDNNLSNLCCLNHVPIIRTSKLGEDFGFIDEFFSKHISDKTHLRFTLKQIKELIA